jgi:hypothetical protein
MQAQNQFIEIAREAVMHLKRLSKEFPQLSSKQVKVAIETWNEEMFRKGEIVWLEQERKRLERSAMEKRAEALLDEHQVDDVLEMLNAEFSQEMDYHALIDLGGRDRYIAAMRREATELKQNSISPELIADLWNSVGKPAVGGERWNATAVSVLMD